MIRAMRDIFKGLFKILVVLSIIGIVILGAFGFNEFGFLVGFGITVGGLLIIASSVGVLATLLNIDENIETIAENTYEFFANFTKK
jgi:hypothetical protein